MQTLVFRNFLQFSSVHLSDMYIQLVESCLKYLPSSRPNLPTIQLCLSNLSDVEPVKGGLTTGSTVRRPFLTKMHFVQVLVNFVPFLRTFLSRTLTSCKTLWRKQRWNLKMRKKTVMPAWKVRWKSFYNEKKAVHFSYHADYVPSFAVEMIRNKQDLPMHNAKNIVLLCV